jgi:replicative DNA helicase
MQNKIEKSLLSILANKPDLILSVADKLQSSDFSFENNAIIFNALLELKTKGEDITVVTVSDKTQKFTLVGEVFANFSEAKNVDSYITKILETSKIKKLKELGTRLCEGESVETAMQALVEISKNNTEDSSIKSAIRDLEKMQEINIKHLESGKQYIGIETGIEEVDKMTDGIQRSYMWLVNAYTSVGKTFFALNAIVSALKQGKRVCLIALEMDRENLAARIIGMMSGTNAISIMKGYNITNDSEMNAKAQLYDYDLTIHRKKRYLDEIMQTFYSEHFKKPVDLFVVDYLQHIKVKDARSRYDRFTDASNEFQDFAANTGVPILLLSQIDNASAKSGNTDVIATKGSGDVPGDSDVAILLQYDKDRQASYQEHIKAVNCIVQKQRNGMTGKIELIMNTKNGRFDNAKNYGNHI